jgi:hypothetical protein
VEIFTPNNLVHLFVKTQKNNTMSVNSPVVAKRSRESDSPISLKVTIHVEDPAPKRRAKRRKVDVPIEDVPTTDEDEESLTMPTLVRSSRTRAPKLFRSVAMSAGRLKFTVRNMNDGPSSDSSPSAEDDLLTVRSRNGMVVTINSNGDDRPAPSFKITISASDDTRTVDAAESSVEFVNDDSQKRTECGTVSMDGVPMGSWGRVDVRSGCMKVVSEAVDHSE